MNAAFDSDTMAEATAADGTAAGAGVSGAEATRAPGGTAARDHNDWGRDVSSGKGKADENFPVGSLLIARRLRPHVHAYYDFARAVDDIADNAVLPAAEKVARLEAMGAVLLGRMPGTERADVRSAVRLRDSNAITGISSERGTDLLVAFKQDAVKGRYADWGELAEYCRFSAEPVGRFLLDLHGEEADTHAPSDALCTALQVLNHLQDLKNDRQELDRCYLPGDWLRQHGESADSVLRERCSGGLWAVIERCLDEVDRLNRVAAALPRRIRNRRMRLEAAVITGLSRRLARRLRREDPLAGRVKLTRMDVGSSLVGALGTLP